MRGSGFARLSHGTCSAAKPGRCRAFASRRSALRRRPRPAAPELGVVRRFSGLDQMLGNFTDERSLAPAATAFFMRVNATHDLQAVTFWLAKWSQKFCCDLCREPCYFGIAK